MVETMNRASRPADRSRVVRRFRLLPIVAAALISGAVVLAPSSPAIAQAGANPEIQTLLNRIERLQNDMNTLQRQIARGGPIPSGAAAAIAVPGEPNLAAAMQVRLDEIETQMRAMTGRLEETNHAVAELAKKLETLASDIDVRFKTAGGAGQGVATAGGPPAAVPAPVAPGVLGTLPARGPGAAAGAGTPPAVAVDSAPTQTASLLPAGSAQDQYRFATAFLAKSDWAGAEGALKAFLEAHPTGELAGNAQYWLGESYYVRGDYNNAALAFAKGYKDFPKSAKGPDNLLKLGLSLAALKKTSNACATFDRVGRDFPNASAAIKSRVAAERKKLRCK